MQLIQSEDSAGEYLEHMKDRFESHFSLGVERFCGFTGRKYFYVIHHCEHEWDRKYNSPKNAAFGFVTDSDGGCEVKFMTFRGLLCPSQFLMLFAFCVIYSFGLLWFRNSLQHAFHPLLWGAILFILCILAPLFTLFESMTDRSEEGHETLLSFLYDPKNHF